MQTPNIRLLKGLTTKIKTKLFTIVLKDSENQSMIYT